MNILLLQQYGDRDRYIAVPDWLWKKYKLSQYKVLNGDDKFFSEHRTFFDELSSHGFQVTEKPEITIRIV